MPRLLPSIVLGCVFAASVCAPYVRGEASVTFSDSRTETGFADSATDTTPPDPFTLTFSNTPTDALSDATVTITAFGDFNEATESVSVSVDGFDLGVFLNSDPADDLFDHPTDVGNQQFAETTASATISLATLAPLILDGELVFLFSFDGTNVSNLDLPMEEFITIDLVFETTSIPPIPEPSSIVLLALGGVGLLGYRWRRKRRAGGGATGHDQTSPS